MTRKAVIVLLVFVGAVALYHVATRPVPISVKVNAGLEAAAERLAEEYRRTQE